MTGPELGFRTNRTAKQMPLALFSELPGGLKETKQFVAAFLSKARWI